MSGAKGSSALLGPCPSSATHLFGCEDVSALDVAVHDALLVEVLQPLEHLGYINGRELLVQCPALLDDTRQGAILHEFQDDV